MAGVGEASAIVGLVATAGKISKAVIDIASRYKSAKKQIESFGLEVGNLGNILDQLQRLYNRDDLHSDDGVRSVASHMVEQCSDLFSELDNYKDTLYSRPGSVQNVTFRGKAKWVFESSELQYLRARVESMKSNMLLMMTIQCMSSLQSDPKIRENAQQLHLLSLQSDACVQRLQKLETGMMIPGSNGDDPVINRMSIRSIDTANEARSIRDSILSLYGHLSYHEKILDSREGDYAEAVQIQVDDSRVSRIIEEHMFYNTATNVEKINIALDCEQERATMTSPAIIPHDYENPYKEYHPFYPVTPPAFKGMNKEVDHQDVQGILEAVSSVRSRVFDDTGHSESSVAPRNSAFVEATGEDERLRRDYLSGIYEDSEIARHSLSREIRHSVKLESESIEQPAKKRKPSGSRI